MIQAEIYTALTPLTGLEDTQGVVDFIGDADFALLGEASHGTHDFYTFRANVTKKLIIQSGIRAVVVEADWPDAYRVNRYVRHEGGDRNAVDALDDFKRFPTWMWRNTAIVEFVEWLREYNGSLPTGRDQVGFYGMDLYALYGSIRAVLNYLSQADAEAAQRARERYACFERYGEDPQAYAYVETFGLESCEDAVVQQLVELQRRGTNLTRARREHDEHFFAEQNARLVKNAEEYYRTMFRGGTQSWNLRDRHMTETIQALARHLSDERPAKMAIWAHNSHLGDARATEMGHRGELNVGQLMREQFPGRTRLIGFTTSQGTVTAAADWDEPVELKRVRLPLHDSYERAFHETGVPRFFLPLNGEPTRGSLAHPRLERAIGVIYRPDTERQSHYFQASLPAQFDGVIHLDHTTALRPLEVSAAWSSAEVPETYPTGV